MFILGKLMDGHTDTRNLSARTRENVLERMATETYDLLIIGGGITGAGIALDAASRGLKTALVEKEDYAWGTSSRSTKLIHGGLRYLKQFEIGLVREVGTERAIVHRNARHVVLPERMLLPIIEGGSLSKFMSSLGLWVYDFLAKVRRTERRRMLSKEKTIKLEPLLRTDILLGGGIYYEYRSDDARLTIENIKSAHGYGADCVNHTEATKLRYDADGKVSGATVRDRLHDKTYDVTARMVVNATGPWTDEVRRGDTDGVKGKRLQLTKGIHLVVPFSKLPLNQAVYFDILGDGRMCFAIPRDGITYIGTTDTFYEDEIDSPNTTREDAEYVLKATNYMFPKAKLKLDDVESTWAGLRPLIHEEGKDPSELSRKDEIFESSTGLLSIAGGKLTGYRKMSERILDRVVKKLRQQDEQAYRKVQPVSTQRIRLSGGNFESQEALDEFITSRTGEVKQILLTGSDIRRLVHKYGSNTDLIIEKAFALYPIQKDPQLRLLEAEIWYGIHHEMCETLNDFLIRRTGRLYFDLPATMEHLDDIADIMARLAGWDESRKLREMAAFKREADAVLAFKSPAGAQKVVA